HEEIAAGILTRRTYDPSIPDLRTDEKRLKQILLNLVRNALQAMSECGGGSLRVETRIDLEHRIDGVSSVAVSICDSGPGIPADVLEQLPTPFFTTRPDGTGLGLAVCHHWIVRLGGTLHIESEPGQGTTARVRLPQRLEESGGRDE
ncbi:MAG: ATP-binding protein, partial [Pseudomonadota bacterium]